MSDSRLWINKHRQREKQTAKQRDQRIMLAPDIPPNHEPPIAENNPAAEQSQSV